MTTILTATERATLTAATNRIVPPREALSGAGDLGVPPMIEATLAREPALRPAILAVLRAIDAASDERGFGAHTSTEQDALLRSVEAAEPLFFALLVEHTYRGYYTLPVVQRALGLSGEPPQPRGHHLPAFDPAILAVQRRRAPFWRKTAD